MACGALQVVGHGPVVLVAELFADQVGDHRGDATQLGMTEGIFQTLVGEELAGLVVHAFGDHDGAVAVFPDLALDLGAGTCASLKATSGNRMMTGRSQSSVAAMTAGGGDPAGVTAHDFQYEDLGRGLGHGGHVKAGLAGRDGDVLGHGTESPGSCR